MNNVLKIKYDLKKYNDKPISIDFNIKNLNNNKLSQIKIVGFNEYNNIKYFDYFYNNNKNNLSIKICLPIYPDSLLLFLYSNVLIDKDDIEDFIYYDGESYENLILNNELKEFIKLIFDFCKSFTILKTNEIYYSDGLNIGIFLIDKHNEYKSPMFINCINKLIYVQKRIIENLTVNEIVNMFLHEYSHCFLNNIHNSEIESDWNALNNYIKLNFSPYHSLSMMNGIIKRNDTFKNRIRKLFFKNNLYKLYNNKNYNNIN